MLFGWVLFGLQLCDNWFLENQFAFRNSLTKYWFELNLHFES